MFIRIRVVALEQQNVNVGCWNYHLIEKLTLGWGQDSFEPGLNQN
jgi:hypothetical protein